MAPPSGPHRLFLELFRHRLISQTKSPSPQPRPEDGLVPPPIEDFPRARSLRKGVPRSKKAPSESFAREEGEFSYRSKKTAIVRRGWHNRPPSTSLGPGGGSFLFEYVSFLKRSPACALSWKRASSSEGSLAGRCSSPLGRRGAIDIR